jgi:cytochrome c oxidase subunit 3
MAENTHPPDAELSAGLSEAALSGRLLPAAARLEPVDHFESLEQQEHAAHLGMWLFLTSEVLLFGALFGLYTAYRVEFPKDFSEAVHHNNLWLGSINTVVLITSSFSAAWAVHSAKRGARRAMLVSLGVTLLLGAGFLVLKFTEYGQHFAEGIYPGAYYRFQELPTPGAGVFFTLYFFLTGLHALHVIGGMSALGVLTWLGARGHHTPERHTALELGVLYWHLVDVIWIFLWPLMYLQK